ncbi:hypothetical protein [Allomesorhizobium camelthorni]|uniref:Uncharacterized protein n=1 Tax=Allomesorhizobium camelthorni TaxID=475069 RepID=A0A6G4WIT4_9HYPH|nr:hypothetical protein [Mesorhizobium camelthorni]NGO54268.1 hypothetical protein [Mesorhizobium camelthorni]
MTDVSAYSPQVALLVRTLPYRWHEVFAPKGGPPSNSSMADMLRLPVNIDLTDLSVEDRGTTLKGIDNTLERLR